METLIAKLRNLVRDGGVSAPRLDAISDVLAQLAEEKAKAKLRGWNRQQKNTKFYTDDDLLEKVKNLAKDLEMYS